MFQYLRRKKQPDKIVSEPKQLSAAWLTQDSSLPVTLWQINGLPDNAKKRVYHALLPPNLLAQFKINPITWKGPCDDQHVLLKAEQGTGQVNISMRKTANPIDEFFCIELADNSLNGIDLHLLLLNDPNSPYFGTDYDEQGHSTLFGTVHRNLLAEEEAMRAGLAPGQIRKGLSASGLVLQQIEVFLNLCSHRAYFLEPLTYASAWIFERRGFAYVRGHKLMDDIHAEFQPGGRLHQALDGSTPFRQLDQWRTVRGRAWAIHDGILQVIDARWDKLHMIKQVGCHAGVQTFPDAIY